MKRLIGIGGVVLKVILVILTFLITIACWIPAFMAGLIWDGVRSGFMSADDYLEWLMDEPTYLQDTPVEEDDMYNLLD